MKKKSSYHKDLNYIKTFKVFFVYVEKVFDTKLFRIFMNLSNFSEKLLSQLNQVFITTKVVDRNIFFIS